MNSEVSQVPIHSLSNWPGTPWRCVDSGKCLEVLYSSHIIQTHQGHRPRYRSSGPGIPSAWGLWLRFGARRIWPGLWDFPGNSSERQEEWLALPRTFLNVRGLSPEAPCSLSQALKIKLQGRSYSGLNVKGRPEKERGSQVSWLGPEERARRKGRGGSAPMGGAHRPPAQRRWPGP